MTQAYRLTCGILLETVTEQTVMLKASASFCQMMMTMMIWRGQLVILQTLELSHCEDGVTGKGTVDDQFKVGLIINEDTPLVKYLKDVGHVKISLGTAVVISLVQETDEPVLNLVMEWE
jgi:hypothetical protein